MKKFFALLLALSMALALGCERKIPVVETPAEDAANMSEAEITPADESALVASVGGEEISFGEYQELFNTYAEYYVMMGYDLSAPEALESLQDFIVDVLVEEKLVYYQAQQAGYGELSAGDQAEIEQQVTADMESVVAMLQEQADAEAEEDPSINAGERLAELIADEAEYMTGIRMSQEELEAWYTDMYTRNWINSAFQEAVLAEVSVTDEQVKARYDEWAAEDKAKYDETPGEYKIDKENEELYGEDPVLYAPEGYKRALHILIMPEEELPAEYTDALGQMDALREEYGQLAFDAQVLEVDDKGRLNEIAKEYAGLAGKAEDILAEYNATSVARAEEALGRLEAGESFAAVMEEYSMSVNDPEKGVLISNEHVSEGDFYGEEDWSNEIKSAFATLDIGQYTGVIQDDEGCHILYYLADEPAGMVELSTVQESIRDIMLTEAQTEEWTELMDIWRNDGSVELNQELIRSVAYMG